MRISLTMIVRDEERNLPRCLGCVRGLFSELVIVDTGSKDRTRDIAHQSGAKIVEFPWCDDFAAARNVALDHATGDYAFWLDGDDVVLAGSRRKLEALFRRIETEWTFPAAYRMACLSGRIEPHNPTWFWGYPQTRLFPVRPDVRWRYPIHEVPGPSLDEAGLPVCATDIPVLHDGYEDPGLERAKVCGRNDRILAGALAAAAAAGRPDPYLLIMDAERLDRIGDHGGSATAAASALEVLDRLHPGLWRGELEGRIRRVLATALAASRRVAG